MDPNETIAPVVCTLGVKPLHARALEWVDLRALALTTMKLADGAESTYDLGQADAIDDLGSREMDCCGSWLDIAVHHEAAVTRLTVTTRNPDGVEVIHSMLGVDE